VTRRLHLIVYFPPEVRRDGEASGKKTKLSVVALRQALDNGDAEVAHVTKRKYALITGSSRGIGRGIALKLAEQGVKVAINYCRNEVAANDALGKVRAGPMALHRTHYR
jgi:short subunit dehydrogenase